MSKGAEFEGTVSTPMVGEIFASVPEINNNFVARMAENGLIRPEKNPKGIRYWRAEDIFRIFCFAVLLREYNRKRGISGRNSIEDYRSVMAAVGQRTFREGYKDFTSLSEWADVSRAAQERGIDIQNTRYRFGPKVGR